MTDIVRQPQAARILIVDDEAANRWVLRTLLEHSGFSVDEATNWTGVLEALSSSDVDVVLLDLRMPEVDGYEMARRIRDAQLDEQPRILAVSGDATEETRRRVLRSGFDDFCPKPFRR